jgi:ABC-type transporter Mla maintaining outer membrane lipid asymmetry ATPase subunit MlaF
MVNPIIEVKGLHKSFGDHEVLAGIDLKIMPNEVVAIIGPSGSGKSTFLHLVGGMLSPTEGKVRIENDSL